MKEREKVLYLLAVKSISRKIVSDASKLNILSLIIYEVNICDYRSP